MIKEDQVEAALEYLANSVDQHSIAKSRVDALEYLLKIEKAMGFLAAYGTVAEREAQSMVSDKYRKMVQELEESSAVYFTIDAKRKNAVLTIDVWRTEAANARRG